MTPLRILTFSTVITVLAVTAPEVEAGSLHLPQPDILGDAASSLAEPLGHQKWTCSPATTSRCDCLEFSRGSWQTFLFGVDDESRPLQVEYVVFTDGESRLEARDVTIGQDDHTTVIAVGEGSWRGPKETNRTLSFQSAELRAKEREILSASLRELSWTEGPTPTVTPRSCDDDAPGSPQEELSSDRLTDVVLAHADSVDLVDENWRISNLRIAGTASPRMPSTFVAGQSLSGFLPPTIAIHDDGARLSTTYHIAAGDLSLRAHADTAKVAGVGIGRWSTSAICDRCRPQPIFLDVYAGTDGFETAQLTGDFAAGDPGHHLSVSVDGLSAGSSTYDPGPAERLARGAFFRPWSMHRAGASFDGSHHNLSIGTALAHDSHSAFDLADRPAHATHLWIDYGTRLAVSDGARADVRLQHAEFDPSTDDSGRLTRLALTLDRPLGSPNRAYLRPLLRGDMLTEVASAPEGVDAGSRGQFDVLIDGGLAFRGELASLDHLVVPRAFVGRRLFAEDALPGRLHATQRAHEALHRRGPFNLAGLALDQRLRSSSGRQLRIPVSTAAADDGRGSDWSVDSRMSIEYASSSASRPVVLGLDARCSGACSESGLQNRLQLTWSDAVDSTHITGVGLGLHPGALPLDQEIRSGRSPWFFSKSTFPLGDTDLFHASSVRARWSQWSTKIRILADLEAPSDAGLEIMMERYWPLLGWGTALHLAAHGDDGRWAAMLGLRNSPAF